MLKIEELPRTALTRGIQLARLPLTTFEAVARRGQDNTNWGPAQMFERYEVEVKERVATLVGDDELRSQAALQRAKLAKLEEAEEARLAAERKAAQADADLRRREEAAEHQRQNAERKAAEEKAELARRKAEAKQQVDQQFEKREEAVEKVAQVQERMLDEKETEAERRRLQAEAAVLAGQEKAVGAKGRANALDKAVETTKAKRKAR